ncbi:MAG: carboxypeptidase-like regulatory domain-containing protein, partial [Sediminibacterium sp.]
MRLFGGLIIVGLLAFCSNINAQEKYTLNGYIKDTLSNETLIGATINIRQIGKSILSNSYGFFSLTLPKGKYFITIGFIGYQSKEIEVDLSADEEKNFYLVPNTSIINNVTVTTRRRDNNVKTAQMGKFDLNINTAKALPAFLGEVDILKT